jgi:hypothetical protein
MLNQCLTILKREDVKQLFIPLVDIVLDKWKPYIWGVLILLFLNIVVTCILLFQLQKKYFLR